MSGVTFLFFRLEDDTKGFNFTMMGFPLVPHLQSLPLKGPANPVSAALHENNADRDSALRYPKELIFMISEQTKLRFMRNVKFNRQDAGGDYFLKKSLQHGGRSWLSCRYRNANGNLRCRAIVEQPKNAQFKDGRLFAPIINVSNRLNPSWLCDCLIRLRNDKSALRFAVA